MRGVRALVAIVCGLGYWVWATVAVVAGFVSWAASEQPPFSEERLVFWLAFSSWLLASAVVARIALGRDGVVLFGLWAIQAALLVAALVSTLDFGGVRVAPPLVAIGVAGQLAGLVSIAVRLRGWIPSPGTAARRCRRPECGRG